MSDEPNRDVGAERDPAGPLGQATVLLQRMGEGDSSASEELLAILYEELRGVAGRAMDHQPANHTLQPTALVHEVWLKLLGDGEREKSWSGREHFLGVAARAMRHVLVDHARARNADKRGLGWEPVPLDEGLVSESGRPLEIIALNDALDRLVEVDSQLARIVELRFFAGLTIAETARVLGVSTPTVERGWRVARMWLRSELPDE